MDWTSQVLPFISSPLLPGPCVHSTGMAVQGDSDQVNGTSHADYRGADWTLPDRFVPNQGEDLCLVRYQLEAR